MCKFENEYVQNINKNGMDGSVEFCKYHFQILKSSNSQIA
jgi:hypothetical protein